MTVDLAGNLEVARRRSGWLDECPESSEEISPAEDFAEPGTACVMIRENPAKMKMRADDVPDKAKKVAIVCLVSKEAEAPHARLATRTDYYSAVPLRSFAAPRAAGLVQARSTRNHRP